MPHAHPWARADEVNGHWPAQFKPKVTIREEIDPVVSAVDPKSHAESRRPTRQVPVAYLLPPAQSSAVNSGHHLPGTQQDGTSRALSTDHHVGAVVHAVGEVHIQQARRTEHRRVASRLPAVRMRPGILPHAAVGLSFDNAHRHLAGGEVRAEQRPGRVDRVSGQLRGSH